MAKYKTPTKLDSWKMFAAKLYEEWDADPGYYAMQHTEMHSGQRERLAVAWCAYYNLGIAADASRYEGKRFWDYLESIYDTAKRNTERRHFRGNAGRVALAQWRTRWPKPEAMVDHIASGPATYFGIRKQCSSIAQYGDYFYWKWCDLHEVLGYGALNMVGSAKHSPKLPQQGAMLIYNQTDTIGVDGIDTGIVEQVYDKIVKHGIKAMLPPRTTKMREFGIQEAETVACVYKQMSSGGYTYGTRTAKAVRRLRSAESKIAADMVDTLLYLSPYTEAELNAALDSLTEK